MGIEALIKIIKRYLNCFDIVSLGNIFNGIVFLLSVFRKIID